MQKDKGKVEDDTANYDKSQNADKIQDQHNKYARKIVSINHLDSTEEVNNSNFSFSVKGTVQLPIGTKNGNTDMSKVHT